MKWLCWLQDKKKEAEETCLIKCKLHWYTSLFFLMQRPLNVNYEEESRFPFCFSFNSKELICSVFSLLRPLLLLLLFLLLTLLLCCVIFRSRCAQIMPNISSCLPDFHKKGGQLDSSTGHSHCMCNLFPTTRVEYPLIPLKLQKSVVWHCLYSEKLKLTLNWLNGSNECSHWKAVTFAGGHALHQPPATLQSVSGLVQAYRPHNSTRQPNTQRHT